MNLKKRFEELFNDKKFYKNLFLLSMPIILQQLIASSLNMLDTVMIGMVGETELASVGIANQYYFLFNIFVMGISSGCSVFISQLWGKKDKENIKKVLGIGLISGLVITALFTAVALFVPESIIGIFNKDEQVIKIGSEYLIIVCISYVFTAISFNFAAASRSIENTVLPMIASLSGLICNGILNYIFIFGKFGFEAMGVRGAAFATLIARMVESIILIAPIYLNKGILRIKFKEFFTINKDLVKSVYSTIIPVILNEACWGLGTVTYAVIYGRIGTQASAAIQICTTIQNLFMIIAYGLANASVVVIGKEVGSGREERSKLYARRLCAVSALVGLALSVILALSAPGILSLFNVSKAVLHDALLILYIYAIVMTAKIYNVILIVGILRGGGDSKFGAILQGVTLWLIGVPLAFITAFIFKLPVYIVALMTAIEETIKVVILIKRFISNKWINNVIENIKDKEYENKLAS
ncbi:MULTISPECIES: MATE family efflux transporter [Clostridium]|nr:MULTISPECIES: MATE family efflux transporter [Clostridium]MDU1349566.1 MATE family efflux transporter [Clostridium argentinense]